MNEAPPTQASRELGTLPPTPVVSTDRISSVDTLRGFALLGILLMNIVGFALPGNAYDDPTIAGGTAGANLTVWAINYVLFEGKMRTLFSMLFGAGVILLTSRLEKRGAGTSVADIYYRRTLWLVAFGLFHAYFIWNGDILYAYGLVGLMLFPLRRLPAKHLIVAGLLVLAMLVPKRILESLEIRSLRDKAALADAAAAAGKTLTEEQRDDQRVWADKLKELKPPRKEIEKEIADYRAGYWKLFARRAKDVTRGQSIGFYRWGFFDVAGMMLLGMGLLKLGLFSGQRRYREYAVTAVVGYTLGIAINAYVAFRNVRNNFGAAWLFFDWTPYGILNWAGYDLQRLAVALAHLSVLIMVCKAGLVHWLTSRLAAVGQMALSNYLMHSVVCTMVFNGYGLGLFGRLQRFQIYGVVLALWIFQLTVSKIWLRYFRFGPVEWLWRSLTYWQRQPMPVSLPVAAVRAAAASA